MFVVGGRQFTGAVMQKNCHEFIAYENLIRQPSRRQPSSQARERRIGDFFKRKTLMFNGYADQVAGLYTGLDLRKNY